jgi:FkbM family methyltransferase
MTTDILGFTLKIVDAFSFLRMAEDIFGLCVYRFDSNSPSPYVIDAGANIGLSAIYFKQLHPTCEVVALEPDPHIFQILQENLAGYSSVNLIQAALSSTDGQRGFFAEGSWAGRLTRREEVATCTVPSVRLRHYLTRHVDLLKLDIEGAETDVLFDCEDHLSNVDHLFCEYHSFAGDPQILGQLLTLLTEVGFRYFINGYTQRSPFIRTACTGNDMDLQLNIFAKR